jgi:hypothetical protein
VKDSDVGRTLLNFVVRRVDGGRTKEGKRKRDDEGGDDN